MIVKINKSNRHLIDNKIYDICIVGAGAAGMYLMDGLIEEYSIAIIEAGGDKNSEELDKNFTPVFSKNICSGSLQGRSFGLGGTTSKWSGQTIPSTPYDNCNKNPTLKASWDYIISLNSKYKEVVRKKILNKSGDPRYLNFFNNKHLKSIKFIVLTSEWLSPRKRNLYKLFNKKIKKSNYSHIFINSVVKSFNKKNNSIESLEFVSDSVNYHLAAKKFILCNGAIEGTRLILELFKGNKLKPKELGHYLQDHIFMQIGNLSMNKHAKILPLFRPVFENNNLRSYRLLPIDNNDQAYFVNFVFNYQSSKGFLLINNFFSYLQGNKELVKMGLLDYILGFFSLFRLALDKVLFSRLYIPKNTTIELNIDFEQSRSFDNEIYLTELEDKYGRKKINISWEIEQRDIEKFHKIGSEFIIKWNKAFPEDKITLKEDLSQNDPSLSNYRKPFDIAHPVGTCRLGNDKKSIVDFNFRIKGVRNLFMISTAIIPTAVIANPTFSLFCFAEQLISTFKKNKSYID